MSRLFGVDVIVSHEIMPVQRMKLDPKVPVSDEFRARTNAWMLEFFGMGEPIYTIGEKNAMIVMRARLCAQIERDFANACSDIYTPPHPVAGKDST